MSGPIAIHFQEAIRELHSFIRLAKFFVVKDDILKLERFKSELQSFQNSGFTSYAWKIPKDHPVRTLTAASYEPDSKGAKVYATISCIWEVEKIPNSKPPAFQTTGLASTRIRVFNAESNEALMDWNMDVGDANSPGCHFHAQLGAPFPVPRLPTLAVSPAAAMEFALSELFQKDWPSRAGGTQPGAVAWRRVQRDRILCFLQWIEVVVQGSMGSPWPEYKAAKPPVEIFIARPRITLPSKGTA